MSSKSAIATGPSFHLYHDLADEDAVQLELDGVRFETTYNRVVVLIPAPRRTHPRPQLGSDTRLRRRRPVLGGVVRRGAARLGRAQGR